MRASAALVLLLASGVTASAQQFKMEPGPKSPADSLKCIKVRPGFKVELMAAEPLVMDPIAFAWGPDGKFWVVEMGDYPLGVDGKGKFGGNVKFLMKSKDDGPYTKATVFLDNLGYPTGVTPWGKGVIVTCAPDIFYAEDTKGTGKADKKIILFTGFREGNQQHRVNGLVWGLDNWLYGANGDSGGVIKAVNRLEPLGDGRYKGAAITRDQQGGVNISGRDFRIKPETGEIEAVTGQTQFGRCRDDWGNWFGCNNSNPMYHFVLEDRYLKRNPHILYPDPKVNVSVTPGAARVYPISKALPRFNSPEGLNHFTSACSIMIYRDDLFGPDFYGNSFVSEPVHNLVHREVMKPKGVTFTSQRAADEQTSEFLASSDVWFRPTTIATGPDGALWIADMYRYVIEHPEWIPLNWQKKLELRAGHDLGRIYRVYPKDKSPRAIPRMDKMRKGELVRALDSPNGWTRDTAQQILIATEAKGDKDLPEVLRVHFKGRFSPVGNLHYACTLDALEVMSASYRAGGLNDKHPMVRRHAIQLCEPWFNKVDNLGFALFNLLDDPDSHVGLQLAYTLGAWNSPQAGMGLGHLLAAHADDRFFVAAVMSSVGPLTWEATLQEVQRTFRGKALPRPLLEPLLRMVQVHGSARGAGMLLASVGSSEQGKITAEQLFSLASLLDILEEKKSSLSNLWQNADRELKDSLFALGNTFAAARKIAVDSNAPLGDRAAAIRLLGRGFDHQSEDVKSLISLLSPQTPDDLQSSAIQNLGRLSRDDSLRAILKPWKGYSPSLRNQVVDIFLMRSAGTSVLIASLQSKDILPSEIDTIRRQKLLDHRDPEVRRTAAKLFAAASNPDRAKLVDTYWITLPQNGEAINGAKLFEKHCAACHQLAGIGQQVGPDLASVGDKSPQGLLTAILDPNKAVEARYVNYVATTKSGLTLSGLLQSETSTTITLVAADGKKHELLRKDIDELSSTGKSVMPEGFEKEIPPTAMADLIAFLRGNLAKPKSFPGNRPETVKAGSDGSLKLLATNAAVYGKTLMYEEKHHNLGYWVSADDQAIWTIDVPKEGRYEVWIDFACETAGNSFALTIGDAKLTHKVANTASWELYRRAKIGTLRLAAGRQDVVMRAEGTIRGALIDLKEIHLVREKD